MKEVTVTSWPQLIEELYANSWQEDIQRYRSNYAFRGLPDKRQDLKTSLMQLGGDYPKLEFHLLRNFIKYARVEDSKQYSTWKWLTLAQQHGLPTRLLDWTYSPFTAMHFATVEITEHEVNGAVWCVDFVEVHRMLPKKFKKKLQEEGANVFTVEMLSDIVTSLQELDSIADDPFILFFEPPSMDERIVNQYALHSMIADPTVLLDEILAQHPELCKKVIIPKPLMWEVRDKLDQANINERVMFPGLDGLCKWLKRHYTPR